MYTAELQSAYKLKASFSVGLTEREKGGPNLLGKLVLIPSCGNTHPKTNCKRNKTEAKGEISKSENKLRYTLQETSTVFATAGRLLCRKDCEKEYSTDLFLCVCVNRR